MKKYLLDLARQDSTWKGIISIITAGGLALKPEQSAAIVSVGMGLVGLIQVFITQDAPKQ